MNNIALRYHAFGVPSEQLMLQESELTRPTDGKLRVAMSLTPINPSDLIPVTGAYAHRIRLPAVAGYEGVGKVIDAPPARAGLIGKRVLPLRGSGTWQRFVDCDPALAIVVPDDIDETTAARSYINPLAALRMLRKWPVHGKHVVLTAAGSTCANLLGLWARQQGAREVTGIYRSTSRINEIESCAVNPVCIDDRAALARVASQVDITFDALGGSVATSVLEAMRPGRTFVGYGLLTGHPIQPSRTPRAHYRRFHLRDELETMTPAIWQHQFDLLWPRLRELQLSQPQVFPIHKWRAAIQAFTIPGRKKPILDFSESATASPETA